MHIKPFIDELLYTSKPITISFINKWSKGYNNKLHLLIRITECKKWDKWLDNNEIPLPCCCPSRNEYCVFIELYFELEKLMQLHKKEPLFNNEILAYEKSNNTFDKQKWLNRNFDLGAQMNLNTNSDGDIRVKIYNSYPLIDLAISKQDFKGALRFSNLFDELYYSILYEMNNQPIKHKGSFKKSFEENNRLGKESLLKKGKPTKEEMLTQAVKTRIRAYERKKNKS